MSSNESQSPVRSSSPANLPQDDNPFDTHSETESGPCSREKDVGNPKTRPKFTKEKFQYYAQRRQYSGSSHPSPGTPLAEDPTEVAYPETERGSEKRSPTIQRCGAFYGSYTPPTRKETPPHGIKVLVTSEDGKLMPFEDDREDEEFVLVEAMNKMRLGQ